MTRVSIRLRLTLWNASVVTLLLIAFALAGWGTLVVTLRVRGDTAVSGTAHAIAAAVTAERVAARARGEAPRPDMARDALRELRAGDLDVFIVDEAANVVVTSRRRFRGKARTSASSGAPPPMPAKGTTGTARAPTRPTAADSANVDDVTSGTAAAADSAARAATGAGAQAGAPAGESDTLALPVAIRTLMQESVAGTDTPVRTLALEDGPHRAAVVRVPRMVGDDEEPALVVAVTRAEDEDVALLTRVRTTLLLAIPVALLVSVAAGYAIARRSLAPVEAMASQAARISAATLDERLSVVNEHDELGQLATIINALLARMHEAFRQQRQFVADASHELRTPIAIVRGETDVTLQRPHRDEAEYREALSVIKDESIRLTRIVDDLFLLARADAGAPVGARDPVDLRDVALAALRSVRTIAEERGISLEYHSDDELRAVGDGVIVLGDTPLLRRLLLNLLDNAIKYTPRGGRVTIGLQASPTVATIRVSDTGPGIAPALRSRVFDRFVRAAPSPLPPAPSATTTGHAEGQADTEGSAAGAGLGLAIAAAIAQTHDGTLTLEDSVSGASFRIELPRRPAPGP